MISIIIIFEAKSSLVLELPPCVTYLSKGSKASIIERFASLTYVVLELFNHTLF